MSAARREPARPRPSWAESFRYGRRAIVVFGAALFAVVGPDLLAASRVGRGSDQVLPLLVPLVLVASLMVLAALLHRALRGSVAAAGLGAVLLCAIGLAAALVEGRTPLPPLLLLSIPVVLGVIVSSVFVGEWKWMRIVRIIAWVLLGLGAVVLVATLVMRLAP